MSRASVFIKALAGCRYFMSLHQHCGLQQLCSYFIFTFTSALVMLVESLVMLAESRTVVFSSDCLRTMYISPSSRRLYYIALIHLSDIYYCLTPGLFFLGVVLCFTLHRQIVITHQLHYVESQDRYPDFTGLMLFYIYFYYLYVVCESWESSVFPFFGTSGLHGTAGREG